MHATAHTHTPSLTWYVSDSWTTNATSSHPGKEWNCDRPNVVRWNIDLSSSHTHTHTHISNGSWDDLCSMNYILALRQDNVIHRFSGSLTKQMIKRKEALSNPNCIPLRYLFFCGDDGDDGDRSWYLCWFLDGWMWWRNKPKFSKTFSNLFAFT